MSSKNMIHSTEVTNRQSPYHSRHLLLLIGLVLLVALAVTLVRTQPESKGFASSSETDFYSNALSMQYAQPWLDKAKATVPDVGYGHALEMQYAQPWLDKQTAEIAPAVQYGNALEMQYAQPWLDKAQAAVPSASVYYSDALETQPSLDNLQVESCGGLRLDEMYACQYRKAQLQQ